MFGKRKAPAAPSRHYAAARQIRLTPLDTGTAQVNLEKANAGGQHVSLVKRAQSVGEELQKRGLLGRQAEPWLLLDRSGSMYEHYQTGSRGGPPAVQTIVERALAFALLTSPTGVVNVLGFGSNLTNVVQVTQDNYRGVIGRDIALPSGTTNMTAALQVVMQRATSSDLPLFVTVVADGGADDEPSATRLFCDLSQYAVFIKLLSVIPVPYFSTLDDLDDTQRFLDNIDAKPEAGGKSLLTMDDDEFAAAMVDEWDTWITLAQAARILV